MGDAKWVWDWEEDEDRCLWRQYENSEELERRYLRGEKTFRFTTGIHYYELRLLEMLQINLSTDRARRMRRRPVFHNASEKLDSNGTPIYWDLNLLPSVGYERMKLETSSPEYSTVLSLFNRTMTGYNILSIERIQNLQLWEHFKLQREHMNTKAGQDVDERLLFHGTSTDHVDAICRDNIDWRLCGKNGTFFGEGSYFARDAKYSDSYTSRYQGTKSMFVCRVLVGDFTVGNQNDRKPPFKDGQNWIAFDSCVDHMKDPSIFVVFEKSQIYPEYLIQYQDPSVVMFPYTLPSSTSSLLNPHPPLPTNQNKQTAAVASGSSALPGQSYQYPRRSLFAVNAQPPSPAVAARSSGASYSSAAGPSALPGQPYQYPQRSLITANAQLPSPAVPAGNSGALSSSAAGPSALPGQPYQYPRNSLFAGNAQPPAPAVPAGNSGASYSSPAVAARSRGASYSSAAGPSALPGQPYQYPRKSLFAVNAQPPSPVVPAWSSGASSSSPAAHNTATPTLPSAGSNATVQLPSQNSQRVCFRSLQLHSDVLDSYPLLSQSPSQPQLTQTNPSRPGGLPPPPPSTPGRTLKNPQSPSQPQLIRTNPPRPGGLPPPPPSTPVPHKKAKKKKKAPLPVQPEHWTKAPPLPQTPTVPPPVPSRKIRSVSLLSPPQIHPSVPPPSLPRLTPTYPPPLPFPSLPRPSPSLQSTQTKARPPVPPKPWLNNTLPRSVTDTHLISPAPVNVSQPPAPVAPSMNARSSSLKAQSTVWATPPPAGSSGTVQPTSQNLQRKLVSDLIHFFDQHSNQK